MPGEPCGLDTRGKHLKIYHQISKKSRNVSHHFSCMLGKALLAGLLPVTQLLKALEPWQGSCATWVWASFLLSDLCFVLSSWPKWKVSIGWRVSAGWRSFLPLHFSLSLHPLTWSFSTWRLLQSPDNYAEVACGAINDLQPSVEDRRILTFQLQVLAADLLAPIWKDIGRAQRSITSNPLPKGSKFKGKSAWCWLRQEPKGINDSFHHSGGSRKLSEVAESGN